MRITQKCLPHHAWKTYARWESFRLPAADHVVTIRAATPADAASLAPLFEQLGYPTPLSAIEARLHALNERSAVFVAQVASRIVGFAAIAIPPDFVEERAVLQGLIVERDARNAGVGAQLVHAAETWAVRAGATIVLVRSNVVRGEAHRFYQREGYRLRKTQHVFEKSCRPGSR